jgi:hypothetical protein
MMRRPVLSAVLLWCILPGPAAGQEIDSLGTIRGDRPLFPDFALESAGAVAGGCGMLTPIGILGALSSPAIGSGDPVMGQIVGYAALPALALGCAVGATYAGKARGWHGSFGWSLGLAAVPDAVACGVLFLNSLGSQPSDAVSLACIAVIAVGTPVMAVVGYNIGATRRAPRSWENRLVPPSFAARAVHSPEPGKSRDVALDARLLTIRL